MRALVATILGLLMSGCSAQSYDPQAAIEIHAAQEDRPVLVEATRAFGQKNGFVVYASGELVRNGRHVDQIDLHRSDGVFVTFDNFMHEDVFEAFFYAKRPEADWRAVRAAWLEEMRVALNGRGEIVEVPVGPRLRRDDEERRQRDGQLQ